MRFALQTSLRHSRFFYADFLERILSLLRDFFIMKGAKTMKVEMKFFCYYGLRCKQVCNANLILRFSGCRFLAVDLNLSELRLLGLVGNYNNEEIKCGLMLFFGSSG